jgi:hypothetical protein
MGVGATCARTSPSDQAVLDEAEADVLAYMTSRRSTAPNCARRIERANGVIERRTEAVGIFVSRRCVSRLA